LCPLPLGSVVIPRAPRLWIRGAPLWPPQVSPSLSAPVVLFTYFNPIMKRGLPTFMKDAKEAGAAGQRASTGGAP